MQPSAERTVAASAPDRNPCSPEPSEQVMVDHYRCPQEFVRIGVQGDLSGCAGFFKFGSGSVCYGRASDFTPSPEAGQVLNDALEYARGGRDGIHLPFELAEAVSALRCEKYVRNGNGHGGGNFLKRSVRAAYYTIRPLTPVTVRKHLQRLSLRDWDKRVFPRWPVDTSVESTLEAVMLLNLKAHGVKEMPFIWFWPNGAQACALMTHDVETGSGRDFCDQLMDIDDSYEVKASFQVIPESRYDVSDAYLRNISKRGFEVGVHDLNHDGNLFSQYEEFRRRSTRINMYGRRFGTKGFRAGVLYRNIDWYDLLDFEYDMSVPNVAHLDPQRGGCCTTFPYFIGKILEIPVTMTQDYSLFHILRNYTLDLWEEQMSLALEKHGMMSFIIHPDYILKEREQSVYRRLLGRLSELRKTAGVWIPLPGEVNEWWRQRSQMSLVKNGSGWKIVGDGKERAIIAHAVLENDRVVYVL